MSTRALVTGATGLLGQHLCRALLGRGYAVRALVRRREQRDLLPQDVELAVGDIRHAAQVRSAVEGCSVVLHACCTHVYNLPREETKAINVEGTRNLCDAAAACDRLVFTSTISTLQAAGGSAGGSEVPARRWNTITKQNAEELVLEQSHRGLPAVVVNPSFFVGPFDYHPSPFRLWVPLGVRRRVRWVPGGGFNVVHAADVAAAHVWALEHGAVGTRLPISGHDVTLVDYVELINTAAGRPCRPKRLPPWLIAGLARNRVFDPYVGRMLNRHNYVADPAPSPVPIQPLEAIVHDTVSWFAHHRRLTGLLPMAKYVWQRYL